MTIVEISNMEGIYHSLFRSVNSDLSPPDSQIVPYGVDIAAETDDTGDLSYQFQRGQYTNFDGVVQPIMMQVQEHTAVLVFERPSSCVSIVPYSEARAAFFANQAEQVDLASCRSFSFHGLPAAYCESSRYSYIHVGRQQPNSLQLLNLVLFSQFVLFATVLYLGREILTYANDWWVSKPRPEPITNRDAARLEIKQFRRVLETLRTKVAGFVKKKRAELEQGKAAFLLTFSETSVGSESPPADAKNLAKEALRVIKHDLESGQWRFTLLDELEFEVNQFARRVEQHRATVVDMQEIHGDLNHMLGELVRHVAINPQHFYSSEDMFAYLTTNVTYNTRGYASVNGRESGYLLALDESVDRFLPLSCRVFILPPVTEDNTAMVEQIKQHANLAQLWNELFTVFREADTDVVKLLFPFQGVLQIQGRVIRHWLTAEVILNINLIQNTLAVFTYLHDAVGADLHEKIGGSKCDDSLQAKIRDFINTMCEQVAVFSQPVQPAFYFKPSPYTAKRLQDIPSSGVVVVKELFDRVEGRSLAVFTDPRSGKQHNTSFNRGAPRLRRQQNRFMQFYADVRTSNRFFAHQHNAVATGQAPEQRPDNSSPTGNVGIRNQGATGN